MNEIYKSIPNFDGYEISSLGNVRTKSGKSTVRNDGIKRVWKQRVLKPQINPQGYYIVKLYIDGKQYTRTVHRLLMIAFYPNRVNEVVNHIDGNKLNNNINNLEWTTYTGNLEHAFDNYLQKSNTKVILKNEQEEHAFNSLAKASVFLGHNHGYLSALLKRGKRNVKGYNIIC